MQVLVAEQLSAPSPVQLKTRLSGKPSDLAGVAKLPDLELAAGDLDVAHRLTKVTAGLDIHGLEANHACRRERMLRRGSTG